MYIRVFEVGDEEAIPAQALTAGRASGSERMAMATN
jgi:hypothetical protein